MAIPERNLRSDLRNRRWIRSLFSIVPAPEIVEITAAAGFECIIFDSEHGPYGVEAIRALVPVAHSLGLPVLVRVPDTEAAAIGVALDLGADGIIVPGISNAAQARTVVQAARFAPLGSRGVNPYVRAAGFTAGANWFSEANERTCVVVMVEGREGLERIDEILRTEGVDMIFVGPFDLSQSLGVPGEIRHPLVIEAIQTIIRATAALGVAVGIFVPDANGARYWRSHGAQFVAIGVDTQHVLAAMSHVIASTNEDQER